MHSALAVCQGQAGTFLREGKVTVAHVGDGRAMLVHPNRGRFLTRDHRVDDRVERARIEAAGGHIVDPYVYRGEAGLMPTRSLGDRWFRSVGVIATPDVATRTLTGADISLVVASDGLWDVLPSAEVARIVREAGRPQRATEALGQAVERRRGRDNLAVIVVGLATTPGHRQASPAGRRA